MDSCCGIQASHPYAISRRELTPESILQYQTSIIVVYRERSIKLGDIVFVDDPDSPLHLDSFVNVFVGDENEVNSRAWAWKEVLPYISLKGLFTSALSGILAAMQRDSDRNSRRDVWVQPLNLKGSVGDQEQLERFYMKLSFHPIVENGKQTNYFKSTAADIVRAIGRQPSPFIFDWQFNFPVRSPGDESHHKRRRVNPQAGGSSSTQPPTRGRHSVHEF